MADKNKITYGLSNVHVWPITATSGAGVPTYGTMMTLPGAIEMSLSAEGDIATLYADNILYWTAEANNGYSGSLKLVEIPEEFAEVILKQIKDSNDVLVEDASKAGSEFAMAFEFEGDVNKKRVVLYRCTASRPDIASSTKEDKIEPNTQELSIKAMPRIDNSFVKASIADSESSAYDAWYGTTPYAPSIAALNQSTRSAAKGDSK